MDYKRAVQSICATIALIGALSLIGLVGTYENGQTTTLYFVSRTLMTVSVLLVSIVIGKWSSTWKLKEIRDCIGYALLTVQQCLLLLKAKSKRKRRHWSGTLGRKLNKKESVSLDGDTIL
ncbi:MAG: hypothetical protein FWE25_08380 [Lachnospiraceae bacterium]|nr:hypothetical protein [Lachnospiraceae bacterium]